MSKEIRCCECGKVIGEVLNDTPNYQNPPVDKIMCLECGIAKLKEEVRWAE